MNGKEREQMMNEQELKAIEDYDAAMDLGMLDERGIRGYAEVAQGHVEALLAEVRRLRALLAHTARPTGCHKCATCAEITETLAR